MKLYQKYLLLLLLLLLGAILFLREQKNEAFINRIDTVLMNLLNTQIEQEKSKAFAFALALSQNETLQNAIEQHNSKKAYEIINRYMKTLEAFSGTMIRTQIITKDLVMFARSWDNRDAGLQMKIYRPDLVEMSKTLKPHLSFEAARRLVLIASIPIVKKQKLVGFVEVIQRVDSFKKILKAYDIDLVVLLDSKYKDQAVLLKSAPRIGHTILANNNVSNYYIRYLQHQNIEKIMRTGRHTGDKHIYFSKTIIDAKGNAIGSFMMILSKKRLELFRAFEDELDTFFTYARKDLYHLVKQHIEPTRLYETLDANALLSLKHLSHAEDRKALMDALQIKLQNYSKEELVSLLLQSTLNQEVRGRIK